MHESRLSPQSQLERARQRWLRIALGLRLAYNPWKPSVIPVWLGLGRRLALDGAVPEPEMLLRSIRLPLQTASDPVLPWAWRDACLAHAARPLARWRSLCALHDPLGVDMWEQRFERAAQQLGPPPRRSGACWQGAGR